MSITNILIILSTITTFGALNNPFLYDFGMNDYFLNNGNYLFFMIQIISYSFLHGGIGHLFFNGIFIYFFGNKLEYIIGKKWFLGFFIFSLLFQMIFILLLSKGNTFGISGFNLALLSFYTYLLYKKGDLEYKGGITAITINIIFGFFPGISLIGHLFGAISGIIYFLIYKKNV